VTLALPSFLPPRLEARPLVPPFLKWPGGKSQELPSIATLAPPLTGRLIDPFVGGGAVLLATPPVVAAWANDACPELVALYAAAASSNDAARGAIAGVASAWDGLSSLPELCDDLADAFLAGSRARVARLLEHWQGTLHEVADRAGATIAERFGLRVERELLAKLERMRGVERTLGRALARPDLLANVEGSLRSSFYMSIRGRYNEARLAAVDDALRTADFFFLREFAYAAMFRFNARGEFNVPYGGVTYNRKSLAGKAALLFGAPFRARMGNTELRCTDFEPFLAEASPTAGDFVFVDPPYDSEFSAYDNRPFTASDQRRLRDVLALLPAPVMLVIKDTPGIRALYASEPWHVIEADKTYSWTIKSRNNRATTHLTITSYVPDAAPIARAAAVQLPGAR
jgi:DNA adenine methylase